MTSSFGTARQRTLGALLRRLRKQSGLSGQKLAGHLGVSQSHLSRVELGGAAATRELVDAWLDETGASGADRATVSELSSSVAAEFSLWRDALAGGLVKAQREIAVAEAAAKLRIVYLPNIVPGLMQTPEYAYHLVSHRYADHADLGEAVAARIQRQSLLHDHTKTLRWVVGEAGLRWRIGPPSVMVAQLDRLAALATEPHLDLRVLPFARTAPVWNAHAFDAYLDRVDGEPDLVNIELLTGPMNIRDPDQVRQYRDAYERLAELAVGGDAAVRLILSVREEMSTQTSQI